MQEEKKENKVARGPRDNQGGRGGRGFGGRERRPGRRGQGPQGQQEEDWIPMTKLGRLVKDKVITKIEEIFEHSLAIKEHQIVDRLMADEVTGDSQQKKSKLMEEVMRLVSVQKQTAAGQRTRFKAIVIVGDYNGHIGVGIKHAKEVQFAIKGAVVDAKLNIIPVRRGYWGNRIGNPHTVPCKVTGKSGSVRVRLIPAPRGTSIVGPAAIKKVLTLAGIKDVYTNTKGKTKSRENFVRAAIDALLRTFTYLTPDLWKDFGMKEHVFEKNSDQLIKLKQEYKPREKAIVA